MPHRGRLNVLANIVGKSYAQIFREFEGNLDPRTAHGSGDVKYHLGAEGEFKAPDGQTVAVSLQANPSHLEAVNPVLEGVVRAKQDMINRGEDGFSVLPVLLHGDAAFAGQGVVAETLQMGQLRGYRTGGTIHVVVNNQVGFTTGPHSARSSVYATDVARMVQAPIFHVNGDDPEACVRVAKLAFDYRQAFKKDVVIDMVCYRRRGHSEVDEPSFTQPLMYDTIDKKRSVRKIYTENLIGRGDISVEEAEQALKDYQQQLEKVFQGTRDTTDAAPMRPEPEPTGEDDLQTAISREVIEVVAQAQVDLPEGFTPHPRLLPQLQKRVKMLEDATIDWAMGETLAYGSLLLEGRPVRLAGQDARRGTFGHRHAVIVDRATGGEHTPLANLSDDQAPFYVYDSLLSEFAAMGFEYGYSVARPDALVLWEAQFGDFVNGAMTIVDEFIASGEVKWGQRSGLTLLLPHGFEGQGPDHSSARVERFLQLCAEDNMVVAAPTTPANYFHLLRRQALQSHKRPLVVLSPKSMLRLRAASSAVEDFIDEGFAPVLGDPDAPDPNGVERVVLTAGKVHYDLLAARRKSGDARVAARAGRAALPGAGRGAGRRAGALPGRHRRRVVPGGAGQPGRVVPRRAVVPRAPARGPHAAPGLPQGRRLAGGRLEQGARGRAGRAHRGGAGAVRRCTSPTGASRSWPSGGARSRSAWPGSPSGCASSSTSTPSSRSRSSAWPPGWRAWTTTRTSRRHPDGWCASSSYGGRILLPPSSGGQREHQVHRHRGARHRRPAPAVPGGPAAPVGGSPAAESAICVGHTGVSDADRPLGVTPGVRPRAAPGATRPAPAGRARRRRRSSARCARCRARPAARRPDGGRGPARAGR